MSKNFEVGTLRLYLVCWAVAAVWSVSFSVWLIGQGDYFDAFAFTAMGVILPGILMLAIRWIYRGFKPKDEAV